MTDTQNIHWTNDEELLEQFVLGRLAPELVMELERHLSDCSQCRDAVRAERGIVAGVKLAGRDALKARLKQRLGRESGSGLNWYRAAGVAAVIVILVTLGIYNRWFFPAESQRAENEIRPDSVAPKLESTPQELNQAQKMATHAPLASTEKPEGSGKETSGLAAPGEMVRGVPPEQKPALEGGKVDQRDLSLAKSAAKKHSATETDRFAAQAGSAVEGAVWVEGAIIPDEFGRAVEPGVILNMPKAPRNDLESRKEKIEALVSKASRPQPLEAEQPGVTVTQQPISALPPMRKEIGRKSEMIQTLLEKNPSGMQMTLFLDSLLSTKDLSQAHVEFSREDSLILILRDRRIGYRIPHGWAAETVKHTGKTK